jgi:hypothetical protein
MLGHIPFEDIAERIQISTAMVIDHALWIAGRARGVVQRNSIPLVGGQGPGVLGVAGLQERFVVGCADELVGVGGHRVGHADHTQLGEFQRRAVRQFAVLRVDDQRLRLAMTQHEQQRRHVEPRIQRIEHGPGHRHAEMRFYHRRNIRQQSGDRVAAFNTGLPQRAGQTPRALVGFPPVTANLPMDDRQPLTVDFRCAHDEIDGCQRDIVGLAPLEAFFKHVLHRVVS